MERATITAAVTMSQIQKGLDVIANNISNISTTGFKGSNPSFSSLLVQSMDRQPDKDQNLGRLSPLGIREGTGSRLAQTQLDTSEGSIEATDRMLDLALEEPNQYFTITTFDDNGNAHQALTRNGTFYLQEDANNKNLLNLVTANGSFVQNSNGEHIQVPANIKNVNFETNGQIVGETDQGQQVNLGRINVVTITHPQLLQSSGDSTYTLPNLNALGINRNDVIQQTPANAVSVKQGALEGSNVDLADQMTQLTNLQRSYQFNARAITISDEMSGLINSIRS
ncbi:flagellar hook-basal body complex protein FlhP [Pullulanibacillus camelliae]|uniref:Flagellar hook-basal body complex protein FlhP n=1 Tax=Pullulanibacillus camelliae TaxID=1707096 RepID=A0A8J2VJX2_9BACL|nr:flagellar hook-basal body protein [Pullulanibacillus camelliae]GGE28202.1 flagellar hook-basal body complex protein FlhP [Pullulanibacillus camelliae]